MTTLNQRSVWLLVVVCLFSSIVSANHEKEGNSFYAYGEVIETRPIIRHTTAWTPRTECQLIRSRPFSYKVRNKKAVFPTLFGGLLGGVIGHQFGGGRGKTALTIAGAFAGASIANNTGRHHHFEEEIERCRVVHDVRNVEKIEGYRVTYLYQGKRFTRTMDQHPGSTVRIRVQVEPANDTYDYSYTSAYALSSKENY